ncbi:MAG TPA: TrmH family RNA methyltransferase [Chloroflexota bacterium]|nr:TrmH family RNA methyltransferase [Chloroflexota bacterium]
MHKLSTAELVGQKPEIEEFLQQPRHPISAVCDNVRSLMNVGLLFRLCDAALVERLYLCGITGYPPIANDSRPPWVSERAGRVIAKTAIHTVEYQPWEYRPSTIELIRELKARGQQIVVLEQTTESISYACAPYHFPLAVVVGHERAGVEDELLELADLVVEIPMYGMGNSLNVAMSFGICVNEMIRCCLGEIECTNQTASTHPIRTQRTV